MVGPQPPSGSSLADRLNHLFATVHPSGRGPFSNEEVAQAIRAEGGDISRAYLAYLRKGERTNPTLHHLEALARFFGVSPTYFLDDAVAADVDAQLDLLVAMRDAGIRAVALRASGLSPRGLQAVATIIDQVRELEGLPPGAESDTKSGTISPILTDSESPSKVDTIPGTITEEP